MNLWTVAHQAPLSKEFPRQENWGGLPFPSPGDLADPGIQPGSPALQADSLRSELPAKSLQVCPTLCDPIDGSPSGSLVPGILQARTLEWVAISFSNAWKWKVQGKSLSRVRLLATPWTAAHQAPPSMGFSRQECWSGVPLPSPSGRYCNQTKKLSPNHCPFFVQCIYSLSKLSEIAGYFQNIY